MAVAVAVVALVVGGMILAAMPDEGARTPSAVTASAPRSLPSAPSGGASPLAATEHSFDFGSISMAAGKVTHRYRIANAGAEPVVIRKLYTSCMCTTATLVQGVRRFGPFGMPGHGIIPAIDQALAPGERAYIEVVFDPAAHGPAGIGLVERVVTIENGAQQPVQLAFSARVTP